MLVRILTVNQSFVKQTGGVMKSLLSLTIKAAAVASAIAVVILVVGFARVFL